MQGDRNSPKFAQLQMYRSDEEGSHTFAAANSSRGVITALPSAAKCLGLVKIQTLHSTLARAGTNRFNTHPVDSMPRVLYTRHVHRAAAKTVTGRYPCVATPADTPGDTTPRQMATQPVHIAAAPAENTVSRALGFTQRL